MTTEEKLNLLNDYAEFPVLTEKHFVILQQLSNDKDSFVRSQVAPLLINFVNDDGKKVLLRLGEDCDEFVRTEAYDALSFFPYTEVEDFLEKAMKTEKDELARGYAILSWADVVVLLGHCSMKSRNILLNLKSKEKIDRCLLNYCYAQYIFGEKSVLGEILAYLRNKNYQIRCSVLNLLRSIASDDNRDQIKKEIEPLLIIEDTFAVKDSATRFLNEE